MREKPPRVPPAAQIAFAGIHGPRVLPGAYTIRMTKAGKVSETKLTVGLDRRAKFSEADRKAQFDAAMKVHALFGDESALMDRILALRGNLAKSASSPGQADPTNKQIKDFDNKVDAVRKLIVATTEGGAITGEERLREHTDQLYGAILSFEGKPADYQIANIDALRRELDDATKDFEQLNTKGVTDLNAALKAKGIAPVPAAPKDRLEPRFPPAGPLASFVQRILTRSSRRPFCPHHFGSCIKREGAPRRRALSARGTGRQCRQATDDSLTTMETSANWPILS